MTSETDLQRSDNCVFLLGAGFSAMFGLPVMRNFLSVAKRNFFSGEAGDPRLSEGYKSTLRFVNECQASSWLMNRDWENIEEIYTQADFLRMCNPEGDRMADEHPEGGWNYKRLCGEIAWTIWDVYRKFNFATDPVKGGPHPPQSIVRLLETTAEREKLRPVVITTNYDVAFETSVSILSSNQLPPWQYYHPGFEAAEVLGYDFHRESASSEAELRTGAHVVPVIKLHGSVNWFRSANQDPIQCFARIIRVNRGDPSNGIRREPSINPNGLVTELCKIEPSWKDAGPAIVPPMLGKSTLFPIIEKQWRFALEAIKRARRLIIVGYSFPDTDAFMVRLLSEGLSKNQQLESIRIVDLQPLEKWKPRIRRIFTPMGRDQKVRFIEATTELMMSACGDPRDARTAFNSFFDDDTYAKPIDD